MNSQYNPTVNDFYVEFTRSGSINRIEESDSRPSQINLNKEDAKQYINASNNLNALEGKDQPARGRWQISLGYYDINHMWDKVKNAIKKGELREAQVTTLHNKHENHDLFIYAYNCHDIYEVKKLYYTLIDLGIVRPETNIQFKSEEQTLSNQYGLCLYTSAQIHIQDMIAKLQEYARNRQTEAGINAFFRNAVKLDGSVKVSACNKLIRHLQGNQVEEFTKIEHKALTEKNSVLNGLVQECVKLNLSLPQSMINYETKQVRKQARLGS